MSSPVAFVEQVLNFAKEVTLNDEVAFVEHVLNFVEEFTLNNKH